MLLKLTINKLKKVVKTQSHKNVGLLAVKWSKLVILETRLNSLPIKLLWVIFCCEWNDGEWAPWLSEEDYPQRKRLFKEVIAWSEIRKQLIQSLPTSHTRQTSNRCRNSGRRIWKDGLFYLCASCNESLSFLKAPGPPAVRNRSSSPRSIEGNNFYRFLKRYLSAYVIFRANCPDDHWVDEEEEQKR